MAGRQPMSRHGGFYSTCNMRPVKDRSDQLRRLISAQMELRGGFERTVSPSLKAEFADYGGLTLQQVEVLRRLLRGQEMTMHDVAEANGIGASAATQLVDRLERRGLVKRVRDDKDRRVQRVMPTERAQEIARRFSRGIGRAAMKLLAVLDDRELETYVELSERLAESWQRDSHRRQGRHGS